jgi:hypothetical protein
LLESRFLRVAGTLQREGIVIHVIARHLIDLTDMILDLNTPPDVANPERLSPLIQTRGHDIPDGRNFH